MLQRCNAVGVVLLIAQGWRGMSQPWVSIRKEIQRCRCCVPLNVLTQGSLHYRLATLGYQKRNPDGVRQSANNLCAAPPFERDEIKKAQHLRRCPPTLRINPG